MCGQTLHWLHCGRRPTAYVNFERPAAHGTEGSADSQTASGFQRQPVAPLHCATPLCAVRSKPTTLLWLSHLRVARHRHHRTSPHQTFASKESGAVVRSKVAAFTFDAHGCDFTAQSARSALHIARGQGRVERKQSVARWGVFPDRSKGKSLCNPYKWLTTCHLDFSTLNKLKSLEIFDP